MGGEQRKEKQSRPTNPPERPLRISAPPKLEGPAAAIWEKERLAQQYLDVAGVMFVGLDSDQQVRVINKKGLEILGCQSEEEVLGKNWFDNFLPPQYGNRVKGVFIRLMEGKLEPAAYYENPVAAKNGEIREIAWSNTILVDEEGNIVGVLSSGEDITEKKQIERELREAEAKLTVQRDLDVFLGSTNNVDVALERILVSAIEVSGLDSGGIYCVDEKGALTLVNHVGLTDAFVQEVSYFGPDSPRTQLVLKGEPIYAQLQKLGVDVSKEREHDELLALAVIPIKHDGKVIACLNLASHVLEEIPSNSRDLLESMAGRVGSVIARLKTTEALRASEEFYREFIAKLPQTVFEIDKQGGFRFANPHGLESFGYTEDDLRRGVSVAQVIAAKDHKRLLENMARIFQGEKTSGNEYTGKRKSGKEFPILIYSSPIKREGEVVGLRGVVVDLTERNQLEAEREARAKTEGVEILATGVAHDLNNLLMGVTGNIDLAKQWLDQKGNTAVPEVRPTFDQIAGVLNDGEDAARKATDLARRLLMFSRKGPPIKTTTDVSQILNEASMFLRGSLVAAEYELPENLHPCEIDPDQISRVIQNIVIIAIQAMPCGGQLKISAQDVEIAPGGIAGLKPGPHVKIAIQDNGPGMSPEVCSRIFQRFFTTKETGTGLGLFNSRTIILEHSGHIEAVSKEGEGTTFYIYLPASDKPQKQ